MDWRGQLPTVGHDILHTQYVNNPWGFPQHSSPHLIFVGDMNVPDSNLQKTVEDVIQII